MIPGLLAICGLLPQIALSHPLGNFTVNHFSRLRIEKGQIWITYIVDMAEIPSFGELRAADTNSDGKTSETELNSYVKRVAGSYASGLVLTVDDRREPLTLRSDNIEVLPGAGGLHTLRLVYELVGWSGSNFLASHRLQYKDTNQRDRIGWREIVVVPGTGVTVFDSSAYSNSVSNDLRAYPRDMLASPLDERAAGLSWATGPIPASATPIRTRDGRPQVFSRDRFAELIAVRDLTPAVAFLGVLIAGMFGAAHALSPGHGKTVVGAYLVGSRGTPRHAAFLGFTVTVTHTAGVFALGLITLFASRYIVPESFFPVLSFLSGALVALIGFSLFARRIGAAHSHSHSAHRDQGEIHADHGDVHSHGGIPHSHLPPGSHGDDITWRSLLMLGVSGGILPCPSALVVLLSAIALHRVGYGLLLVFAFSVGLAATLTGIGLAFVYAGRWLSHFASSPKTEALRRGLPIASAFIVACLGVAICYQATLQMGFDPAVFALAVLADWQNVISGQKSLASMGTLAVLTFGLILGFKHATEADHVIAVSSIVSEHRRITKVALVGGLWGLGHTLTLVLVGFVVLILRIAIPGWISQSLEFGVGLMIIGLSGTALTRAFFRRGNVHVHMHGHRGSRHRHLHFHDGETGGEAFAANHPHSVSRIGVKPLLVGAMHGLAGSAALTLLVLTQVRSVSLGITYLLLFGIGSVFGMIIVSIVIGLPFALSARRLAKVSVGLQVAAGAFGICFGCWYTWSLGSAAFQHLL